MSKFPNLEKKATFGKKDQQNLHILEINCNFVPNFINHYLYDKTDR